MTSRKVSEASTQQTKEYSDHLARKGSQYKDHGDDLNRLTGGVDIRSMGKGQLLLAVKNLVETPYYELDSVIYKLRKELEDLNYMQEDKLIGTNEMFDQVIVHFNLSFVNIKGWQR